MLGPAMPAAAPMSSMLTAWKPRSRNRRVAADSSSSRRDGGVTAAVGAAAAARSPARPAGPTPSTAAASSARHVSNRRRGRLTWCTDTLPNTDSAAQHSSSASAVVQLRARVAQRDAPLRHQLAAAVADLGLVGLVEVAALPAPQRGDLAAVDGQRRDRAQQRVELLLRRARRGQRLLGDQAEHVHAGQQHVREDVLLAAEVPVDRGPGDAGRGGDVVDADLVVAVLAEQLRGRVGQLGLPVARPRPVPGCTRSSRA